MIRVLALNAARSRLPALKPSMTLAQVEDLLTGEKPGEADNRRFKLHPSVAFWQKWSAEGDDQTEK